MYIIKKIQREKIRFFIFILYKWNLKVKIKNFLRNKI